MRHVHILAFAALALGLAACGDSPTQPEVSRQPGAPALSTRSALTVTSLYCEDVGGGGVYYNETFCYAETSGGAGGNTYDWNVIVNYQVDSANSSYIEGVCTGSYPVTITVRDASGATASKSGTFVCYAKSTGGGLEP
jgi:hypothetical protein